MIRYIIILCSTLIFIIPLQAQIVIKGIVVDSARNRLSGVTIKEIGTEKFTQTDRYGNFEFKTIGNQGTLFFQHLGYVELWREFTNTSKDWTIVLVAKPKAIDEVIVSTGYQSISKERATGSFVILDNGILDQQVGSDVLSRLPAIANSVVMNHGISGEPQMLIRGISTIQGPKSPLIVVDNFPYTGDISNINPSTIENITILKDAAASSIWGARAANGVIVITTKKGSFSKAPSFDFNSSVTVGLKPDLRYIPQMSSGDFIEVEQELFSRNFYNSQISSTSRPVLSPVVFLLNQAKNNVIDAETANAQIENWKKVDVRDQFHSYMYKPAINQRYFLNGTGGSEYFTWLSAIGVDRNKDNLGRLYDRINLRFQNTYRPIEKLTLYTNLNYVYTRNKSGRLGYSDVMMKNGYFVPYMQMISEQGESLAVARDFNQGYVNSVGNGLLQDWNYYPLEDWKHNTVHRQGNSLIGNAALNYEVIKGLNANLNYQYEQQLKSMTNHADPDSYMARDYVNRFTQLVNGGIVYIVPKGGILDKSNNDLKTNNFRGQLNYDSVFGRHDISFLLGGEVRSTTDIAHQERYYGYQEDNLTTGNVDYTKTYPSIINGGGSFIQRGQYLGHSLTRFLSFYLNGAYSFDNRYTISWSGRRDASNLFGLKTNDQWNPFWSSGFMWKLSNEKFYSSQLIPYLSLKATYGFSGNIDPSMVAVNTINYVNNTSVFTGTPMARFNNYYNPLLKWETSKMLNLALEFRSKNNRVNGLIEYYHKNSDNLFGTAPLDYTTGVPPYMLRNVASMQGKGWDIQLNTMNTTGKVLWKSTLNLSSYKDKIVEYLVDRNTASGYVSFTSPPISGVKGAPVYAMYAYKWAGLDPITGEAQGYLNSEISKNYASITGTGTAVEDLDFFGSTIPTFFGSFLNTVSYKKISLQMALSFKSGYWFRRQSINYSTLFNGWIGHSDYQYRWQKPGDELHTDIPVNPYTANTQRDAFYNGSSVLVEKGDHIRLQYINITYELLSNTNAKINNLQLYFNANNIGILWKANKKGIDPDFIVGGNRLKPSTNYTIGGKIKF